MTTKQQAAPWAKDCMDRRKVANFLSQHLDNSPHIKVLNVNSEWGSGKTFFVTEWKKELIEERVCVYFDAWKHDYSGDAFVSLVATIKEQLEKQIENKEAADKQIKKFVKSAAKTLLAATPVIAKGLVKKLSTIDIDAISEKVESDAAADAEEASESNAELASEVAEKAVEHLINSKKEALQSVGDFKTVFSKLLKEAVKSKPSGDKPAYIFIDELDRCRPTFAIELLERIKHLFDIEECKFIIASDTSQLAHSITAIYGQGFGAQKYLKRFFDAEFELDNDNMERWVKTLFVDANINPYESVKLHFISSETNDFWMRDQRAVALDPDTIAHSNDNDLNPRQVVMLALIKTFEPRLRELEKLVAQIDAFEKNCNRNSFQFFWAAYLIFLKDADRDLYRSVIKTKNIVSNPEFNGRFRGYKLYFGVSNDSVHELAQSYVRCLRADKSEIRRWRSQETVPDYIDSIYQSFSNYYDELSKYPALVDLAHRLD